MQYDVTIVLGGGCESNDKLNGRSIERLHRALELFEHGKLPKIILSGGISFSAPSSFTRSEASLMREYLLSKRIPEETIFLEEESTDTLGNAFFSKKYFLEPSSWHKILVITSAFHVPRCKYLFRKVCGPQYVIDFEEVNSPPSEGPKTDTASQLEKHIQFVYAHWLDAIEDGDSAAIEKIVFEHHPGYATKPDFTREEFIRLLYEGSGETE